MVHAPLPLFQDSHCPYNEKYKYIRQFIWEVQMAQWKSIKGTGEVWYFGLDGDYMNIYVDT